MGWNVALQITQGTLRTEEAQSLRRCSSPLPEGQEAGCPPRNEIHLLGTWSQILHCRSHLPRGRMEVPGCCTDFGEQEEVEGLCCVCQKGVYKKTKRAAFRAVAPRIAAHQKVVHELGH